MTDLFQTRLPAPSFPLIDVHVHLGASDTGELFYPHLSGDEYRRIMQASNIECAFGFAPMRDDGYRQANHALLNWTREPFDQTAETSGPAGPDIRAFARLGGANMPVTRPELWMVRRRLSTRLRGRAPDLDALEQLDQYDGVKMLPHMDGLVDQAVLERIDELRLPVVVHGGTHSSAGFILKHIARHLTSPVIIAHCGAFPCDQPRLIEAVEIARRHDHIYLDTSGVWISEFLRYAATRVPDKLLFGSDSPLAHPLVAWHHLASVIDDEALLEKIGHTNTRAMLARR